MSHPDEGSSRRSRVARLLAIVAAALAPAACVVDPDATALLGLALDDDGQPIVVIERCRGGHVTSVHVVEPARTLYLDDVSTARGWHIFAADVEDLDAVRVGDVPVGFEQRGDDVDMTGLADVIDMVAIVFFDGEETPEVIRFGVLFPTIGGRVVDPRGFTYTPAEFARQCA